MIPKLWIWQSEGQTCREKGGPWGGPGILGDSHESPDLALLSPIVQGVLQRVMLPGRTP